MIGGDRSRMIGASSTDFLLASVIIGVVLVIGIPIFRTLQRRQMLARTTQSIQQLISGVHELSIQESTTSGNGGRTIGYSLIIEQGSKGSPSFLACGQQSYTSARIGIVRLVYIEDDQSVRPELVTTDGQRLCSSTGAREKIFTLPNAYALQVEEKNPHTLWFVPVVKDSEASLFSQVRQLVATYKGDDPLASNESLTLYISHPASGECRSLVIWHDASGLLSTPQEGCPHGNK